MNKKSALGKGLNAIFDQETNESAEQNGLMEVNINDIEPDLDQPRKTFDREKLDALAKSIEEQGLIQPILVRKDGDIFRIIAGERRWRASKQAGLKTMPVIVKDVADRKIIETALIENLQRQDLNPIEEAMAYDRLIKDYKMTQEQVSDLAGKSRPAVTNTLRLLSLSDKVREYIVSGEISEGHARALIPLASEKKMLDLITVIINKELNVRDTEKLVKHITAGKKKQQSAAEVDYNVLAIEEKLKDLLATKVKLDHKNGKGKIVIEYYSNDDLDRLMGIIGKKAKN